MACTLVHLFDLQHPGNAAREGFILSQQRSSIALTFVTLATTLLNFTLNLVGISKALAAAAQTVARIVEVCKISGSSRIGHAEASV